MKVIGLGWAAVAVWIGTITSTTALAQTPVQAGMTFEDCANACPTMVVIPSGSFKMGMKDYDSSQKPIHKVTFAKPFAVSRTEVTVAEWNVCVNDGGCKSTKVGDGPVTYVSWTAARAYIVWLSAKTGHTYRLLSESEWEYVARMGLGADGLGTGSEAMDATTPNRLGLTGLYAPPNEWVEDCYHDDYVEAPSDGSAVEDDICMARSLRGGLVRFQASPLPRATFRQNGPDDYGNDSIGFRIARDH